jgi:hypothetical protein
LLLPLTSQLVEDPFTSGQIFLWVYRLEHFSNTRAVLSGVQGGFFLRKKPLGILLSLYTNWKNALVVWGYATGCAEVDETGGRLARSTGDSSNHRRDGTR